MLHLRTVRQMPRVLSQYGSENVAQRTFFSWVINNQISSVHIFHFQVYGNTTEEIIMYQQLQKIYKEKTFRIKIFLTILGKFRQNTLCTSKKVSALTPMHDIMSPILFF